MLLRGMIIERSAEALAAVTEDFGHVLRGSPAGLVFPRSAEDGSSHGGPRIALISRIHVLRYLRAAAAARLQEGDPYVALDVTLPPGGDIVGHRQGKNLPPLGLARAGAPVSAWRRRAARRVRRARALRARPRRGARRREESVRRSQPAPVRGLPRRLSASSSASQRAPLRGANVARPCRPRLLRPMRPQRPLLGRLPGVRATMIVAHVTDRSAESRRGESDR